MQKRRLTGPSPAFVISVIALFVALGGTGYAAIHLPRNSVGTKQLKKNAVTSTKIKNKAVTAAKINTNGLTVPSAVHATSADSATHAATATNATNATNATHAVSAASATSATSATTANAPGRLASGHTEYGTIGSQPPSSGTGAGNEIGDNGELPFSAPVALDNAHVQLVGAEATAGQCPGTADHPAAAPGYVCIYPYAQHNATLNDGAIWSSHTDYYGFQMSWSSVSGGLSWVFANWAYTAP